MSSAESERAEELAEVRRIDARLKDKAERLGHEGWFPDDVMAYAYRFVSADLRPPRELALREIAEAVAGDFETYGDDYTLALKILNAQERPGSRTRTYLKGLDDAR